jgi:hypothetical protein
MLVSGGLAVGLAISLPIIAAGVAVGLEIGLVILATAAGLALLLAVKGHSDYQHFRAQLDADTARLDRLLAARQRAGLAPPSTWHTEQQGDVIIRWQDSRGHRGV